MKLLGFIAVFITGVLLFIASGDFPAWGDPASPANASEEVSQRYIQDAYKNMKTPNIVTAVLADYRGFDTMFETCVILVAGIAIISVLSVIGNGTEPRDGGIVVVDEKPNIIVIQTCKLVIPVLQLFHIHQTDVGVMY